MSDTVGAASVSAAGADVGTAAAEVASGGVACGLLFPRSDV